MSGGHPAARKVETMSDCTAMTVEYTSELAREWRAAAGAAGDHAMVAICDRAMGGDTAAQAEVVRCEVAHRAAVSA
jgi:hypothetical protein